MTGDPLAVDVAPSPHGGSGMADGRWHRLSPATPFLRGGIVVIAVIGFLLVQFRDVVIGIVIGSVAGRPRRDDPVTEWLIANASLAILFAIVILAAILGFGWLAWRMHAYRVTDELIEERDGVIWRRHRRGRLDRVQGVDIVRPVLPRLFGAARLEISMAGSDGSIRLSYVASSHADALRADILAAASRRRAAERAGAPAALAPEDAVPRAPAPGVASAAATGGGSRLQDALLARANDFLTPELRERVAPESLVTMHPGRLVGATALRLGPPMLGVLIGAIVAATTRPELLFLLIPALVAVYGYAVREVLRSLQYSIAGTPEGIRVGYGLLSTTNETLPPGRVHAIELSQPLLWRPFGWWRVRINRATATARDGGSTRVGTTLLPVGTIDETLRVVGLVLPDWREPDDVTVSPPRARWLRWVSWRRNGFAVDARTVVLRRGRLWRTLTVVPFARVQSVGIVDGPLTRAMRLARVDVHTVIGVVRTHVGALDADDAVRLWQGVEARTLEALT